MLLSRPLPSFMLTSGSGDSCQVFAWQTKYFMITQDKIQITFIMRMHMDLNNISSFVAFIAKSIAQLKLKTDSKLI